MILSGRPERGSGRQEAGRGPLQLRLKGSSSSGSCWLSTCHVPGTEMLQ